MTKNIKMKKGLIITLVAVVCSLAVVISLFAMCKKKPGDTNTFAFSEQSLEMKVGESKKIEFKNTYETFVSYGVSNGEIIAFEDGFIYALKSGSATVTATDENHTATLNVKVYNEIHAELYVKSLTLLQGQKTVADCILMMDGSRVTENVQFELTAKNPEIISVQDGKIEGKKAGVSKLSLVVSYNGESYRAEKTITVLSIEDEVSLLYHSAEIQDLLPLQERQQLKDILSVQVLNNDGCKEYALEFAGKTSISGKDGLYNANYYLCENGEHVGNIKIAVYNDTADFVGDNGLLKYDNSFPEIKIESIELKNKPLQYEKDNLTVKIRKSNEPYCFAALDSSQVSEMFYGYNSAVSVNSSIVYNNDSVLEMSTDGKWYPQMYFTDLYENRKKYGLEEGDRIAFQMYVDAPEGTIGRMHAYTTGCELPVFAKGELPIKQWVDVVLDTDANSFTEKSAGFWVCINSYESMEEGNNPSSSLFSIYFSKIRIQKTGEYASNFPSEIKARVGEFDLSQIKLTSYFGEDTPFEATVYNRNDGTKVSLSNNKFVVEKGQFYNAILKYNNGVSDCWKCFVIHDERVALNANTLYPEIDAKFVQSYIPGNYAKVSLSYDKIYNGTPTICFDTNGGNGAKVIFGELSENYEKYGIKGGRYLSMKMYIETDMRAEYLNIQGNFIGWHARAYDVGTLATNQWININIPIHSRTVTMLENQSKIGFDDGLALYLCANDENDARLYVNAKVYMANITIADYIEANSSVTVYEGQRVNLKQLIRGNVEIGQILLDGKVFDGNEIVAERGKEYSVTYDYILRGERLTRNYKIVVKSKDLISDDDRYSDWV